MTIHSVVSPVQPFFCAQYFQAIWDAWPFFGWYTVSYRLQQTHKHVKQSMTDLYWSILNLYKLFNSKLPNSFFACSQQLLQRFLTGHFASTILTRSSGTAASRTVSSGSWHCPEIRGLCLYHMATWQACDTLRTTVKEIIRRSSRQLMHHFCQLLGHTSHIDPYRRSWMVLRCPEVPRNWRNQLGASRTGPTKHPLSPSSVHLGEETPPTNPTSMKIMKFEDFEAAYIFSAKQKGDSSIQCHLCRPLLCRCSKSWRWSPAVNGSLGPVHRWWLDHLLCRMNPEAKKVSESMQQI